ncbi:hypothetical protein HCZ13_03430 [Limosilactobacillus fermentum]
MQDFFNITIKTVNDLAMLPSIFGKVIGVKTVKTHKTINKTYGGFTNSDWEKIGNDMKRGLISFGKARP